MEKIRLVVRGKKTSEVREFTDLGNGQVKDENGNSFQIVVNRPDGGWLRGDGRVTFTFPKD